MTSSAERKALNENAFRKANEELEDGARELLAEDDGAVVPFLCECPRQECTQVVLLTLSEYERVRREPRGGFAAIGHEDLVVERVIEQNDRFVMTEKFGRAGATHTATNPRNE